MNSKHINTFDEKEIAVRLTASFADFDGDLDKWKDAFYEIWRYQLTFGFAYEIALRENQHRKVFVDILSRKTYADNIKETMKDLGYRRISTHEETVGLVDAYNREDCADIEAIFFT